MIVALFATFTVPSIYAAKKPNIIVIYADDMGYGDCKANNPEPKEPKYDNSKRVLDVWQPKWIRDKYFDGRSNPNHGKRPLPKPTSKEAGAFHSKDLNNLEMFLESIKGLAIATNRLGRGKHVEHIEVL